MGIEDEAKRERERLKRIFEDLQVKDRDRASEFYEFSQNYFEDGKHFFEEEDYLKSFEAFIISWSYIDIGLKLGFFSVPQDMKKHFTI